jgi:hypothetical protein
LLLHALAAGGPLLPLTILYAPVAIPMELDHLPRVLGLFAAGPLMLGVYPTSPSPPATAGSPAGASCSST